MSHRTHDDSSLSRGVERIGVREVAQRTVEGLLPWAISVLVHLGIVLIAFFVVWSAGQAKQAEDVVPKIGQVTQVDRLFDTRQTEPVNMPQVPVTVRSKATSTQAESPVLIEQARNELPMIGVQGPAIPSLGPVTNGPDGPTIIFPPPSGDPAATVVFCVDASGSMVDTFSYVIRDLQKAISRLHADQRFTVIFFQDGAALEVPVPQRGYKPATQQNVKLVSDWITAEAGHVAPRGATDPVSAIKLALGYQPRVMYLLSDNITGRGRYQVDCKELLSLIDRLQAGHRVKTRINTIQFIYKDALGTLDAIARRNDGVSRFVEESLLGQ